MTQSQAEKINTLPLPISKPWFGTSEVDWKDGKPSTISTVVTSHGCIFLTNDFQCGIHKYCVENGLSVESYKPILCQRFPFEEASNDLREDYQVYCGIYFHEDALRPTEPPR